MGAPQLTSGWLLAVRNSDNPPAGYVQLLEIKPSGQGRFKICVNDGQHKGYLILASQLHQETQSRPDLYQTGTILHVKSVQALWNNNKRVLIIYAMEPVGHVPNTIGNPMELSKEGEGGGDAQASGPPGAVGTHGSVAAGLQQAPGPGPNYGQPPPMEQPGPGTSYPQPGQQPPAGVYPPHTNGNGQQSYPGSLPPAGPGPSYGGPPQQGGPPGSFIGNGAPPPMHGGAGSFGGLPAQAGPGPAYGAGAGGSRPPLGYTGGAGPGGVMVGGRGPGPNYNMQGGGPVARNATAPAFLPIRNINPYTSRWTIKGRCTAKSELKRFNSARSDGKFFSFDLLDKDGGEVRVVAFNEQADKFLNLIQIGYIYTLSKGNVVQKKPQFNTTNNSYEIRLERDSIIDQVPEDEETAIIPHVQYNFKRIEDLELSPIGSIVDIIGVVETVSDWTTITRKTGEETRKRSIILRDDSHRSIEVTLWGAFTEVPGNDLEQAFKSGRHPVVAIKAGRLGEFQGRNLSTIGTSQVNVDPQNDAAVRLRQWYDQGGHSAAVTAMSGNGASSGAGGGGGGARDLRRTTFKAIKDEGLGQQQGKAEWANVNAVINYIRHPTDNQQNAIVVYPSCPMTWNARLCQKKLEEVDGGWNCGRCGPVQDPSWRYLVSFSAFDHTGTQWITAFGDQADPLFGFPASHYYQMKMEDPNFESRIADLYNYQNMILRIKVSEETWNDEPRLKYNIQKFEPVDFVKESKILLEGIHKLEVGLPVLQAREGPAPAGLAPQGNMPQAGQQPQWNAGPSQAQGQYQQQLQQPQRAPQGYTPSANPFGPGSSAGHQQGAYHDGGLPPHQQQPQQPVHGGYSGGPAMGNPGYGVPGPVDGQYVQGQGAGYPGHAHQGGPTHPMQPGGPGPQYQQQYQQGRMVPQYQQQGPAQQQYMGGPPPQRQHGGVPQGGPGMYNQPPQQNQQGYQQYPPQQMQQQQQQQGPGAGMPYM